MNVKVVVEESPEHKAETSCGPIFFVEQVNTKALIDQKSYFKLSGNVVKALVPACIPSVTSQTPDELFRMLSLCYESCISEAASNGAKWITVKPLGVGVKMTRVSELGEVVSAGVWGNLFWTHTRSSMAAKGAVERVFRAVPDEVTVVFVVPQEAFDDWDSAMTFSS